MRRLAPLLALAIAGTACGGSGGSQVSHVPDKTFTIVVDAPFSKAPFIGETIAHGVALAVAQLQGAASNGTFYRFRVQRLDNALSAAQSVRNVRRAVSEGAGVIVTDGTGTDAAWKIANEAHIPICITYNGGVGLVDPQTRPNVFRIAPTDHGVAFRLAEYVIPKGLRSRSSTTTASTGRRAPPRSTVRSARIRRRSRSA
jgi:hypothetical protein